MRNGKTSNESWDRGSSGLFAKLRAPSLVSRLAARFRSKILAAAGFGDAVVASRAGKFIPATVLAVALATTGQLWKNEKDSLIRDFSSEVKSQATGVENAVTLRIKAYEELLMGVRGNFEASEYVNPEEFAEYVASLKLHQTHPEIQSVSLTYYIPGDEFDGHVKSQRDRGFTDYGSHLEKGLAEYAPVVMIAPNTKKNSRVMGYDNFSNLERRTAMERARDFDSAHITEILPLIQNGSSQLERGVIMYLPIYGRHLPREDVADRRRNIVWWVALSFFMKNFMDGVLANRTENLGVEVFDSGNEDARKIAYDSSGPDLHENTKFGVSDIRTLKILNRDWTVAVYPRAQMEALVHSERPPFVLAFWTVTSFVLAFFFWMSIHGRGSLVAALEALKISSSNLIESEKRYHALFKDSKVPMLLVDPASGNVIDANDEAAKYYGYAADELRAMNITQINDSSYEAVHERLLRIQHGLLERFETSHRISSWVTRLVEVSASPIDLGGSEGILQIVNDITERKTAIEKIVQMATHDELTGLPNRTLLMDRLGQAFANADRSGTSVVLMFIDLDQFKTVNDSLWHDVGDVLLQDAAARMSKVVRAGDTVARQGGDEFLIVLQGLSDPSQASVVAEKLISVLADPFEVFGHELHIGASIGMASYPKDSQSADTILKYADTAMYRVKNSGRNSYRFFSQDMHESSVEHQTIANALHGALERQETSVVYQPLVSVETGETIGMEALLRWNHPKLGTVSPVKFVPIAEDTGLIVPIGEWIIREVCTKIAEWKAAGIDAPRVAINLSARQFRLKTLVDDVSRILAETGTDPRRIGLEITESMLIEDVEEAVRTLEKLSSIGFEISIDDFWTGYSSLNYLKRFPVKKLKIDRSFVNDIVTDADDVVIVKSIIDLAHNLWLGVVAEGVENENQLAMLRGMGCDCAQGYLFSRPVAPDAMAERLVFERDFLQGKSRT